MSHKFRIQEIEINGYYFTEYPSLYWHSGKFWFNEKEVKKVYNNGSISLLLYGSKKVSIKKLRKQAKPCTIKLLKEYCPF